MNASILQHEIITPGVISWYNDIFPFSQLEEIQLPNQRTTYFKLHHINGINGRLAFCPDNGIANTYVYYRWDRIAWSIGVISQREISNPSVISLYHGITPHTYECNGVIL